MISCKFGSVLIHFRDKSEQAENCHVSIPLSLEFLDEPCLSKTSILTRLSVSEDLVDSMVQTWVTDTIPARDRQTDNLLLMPA